MASRRFLLYLASVAFAAAADCNTDQPRKSGDPSGQKIANEITAKDSLNHICTGGFPPSSNYISTWNVGSIIFNVTRSDSSRDPVHCNDAFINIIEQCISGDKYWGGVWQLDGEIYTIHDASYPDHILPSDLTASSTLSSSSSSTSSRDTTVPAGATTVTTTVDGRPITQTYVPTTISGASPTTSSTTVDGVVVPLIIGAGGVAFIPYIPVGGTPPTPIDPPVPTPTGDPNPSQDTTTTSSSTSSSSSKPAHTLTADEVYYFGPGGSFDAAAATSTTYYGSMTSSESTSSTTTASAPSCTPLSFQDGTYTPALQSDCQHISPVLTSDDIAVADPNNCQIYPDDMQMVCTFYSYGNCAVQAGWQITSVDPLTPPAKVSQKQLVNRYNDAVNKAQNGCMYSRQGVSGKVYDNHGTVIDDGLSYMTCVAQTGTKCFFLPLQ